jgi:hypothetical protein
MFYTFIGKKGFVAMRCEVNAATSDSTTEIKHFCFEMRLFWKLVHAFWSFRTSFLAEKLPISGVHVPIWLTITL